SFDVDVASLSYGQSAAYLKGQVRAQLVTAATGPDRASPEQDYPSLAAARAGALWLAYQSYEVACHEDRILLISFTDGRWTTPLEVASGGIYYRLQVAIDGTGRVWVVWAQLQDEDWELFARSFANGRMQEPQRITANAGADWNHRLTAAPDGRL